MNTVSRYKRTLLRNIARSCISPGENTTLKRYRGYSRFYIYFMTKNMSSKKKPEKSGDISAVKGQQQASATHSPAVAVLKMKGMKHSLIVYVAKNQKSNTFF